MIIAGEMAMKSLEGVVERITTMLPVLNESQRRRMLAVEAKILGHGGIKIVTEIACVAKSTVIAGIKELASTDVYPTGKIRKKGAGRKKKKEIYPGLVEEIKKRVDSATRGDPESTLQWCSKSIRKLAIDLKKDNYNVSHVVVANILKDLGYSLQANKKRHEGSKSPDRDAQFEYINEKSKAFIREKQPVISIDTKKKELIGNFKNNGQEYAPKETPIEVNAYDFLSDALCKAIPYGIYDIVRNEGWVNVGISSDTAEFAVESIRRWWNGLGKTSYPDATQLMVTADGGGSNGSKVRLFKKQLQQFANDTGLTISVCHFPPGTSKWNKIEHRMFSFISKNWRGRPLLDLVTVVNLIGNTRTDAGLKICCELDESVYEKGIVVTDEEMKNLNITHDQFHGDWNYVISPKK